MTSNSLLNKKDVGNLSLARVLFFYQRYPDFDGHSLPLVLQALSTNKKSFVPLLEKAAANVWIELTADGVETCLNSLTRLRVYNNGLMVYLGMIFFFFCCFFFLVIKAMMYITKFFMAALIGRFYQYFQGN